MPEKFDPFKMGVAETLNRMEEHQHHLYAQSELIRERVYRKEKHLVPRLNSLYDSLRTPQAWRYMADAAAKGTLTTVLASTVSSNVVLLTPPNLRMEQWPNGVQVHLVIRFFGIMPQNNPSVQAGMECIFFDNGGNAVPLGEFLSQSGGNSIYDHIMPTPITDTGGSSSASGAQPNGPQVGILQVTVPSNTSGATQVYSWSMSFSFAYLLPSIQAYDLREEYPEHVIIGKGNHA